MSVQPLNLLVFRDGKRLVSGSSLKSVLTRQIQLLSDQFQRDEILGALLSAGELECALTDCDTRFSRVAEITDALAEALVNSKAVPDTNRLLAILGATQVSEKLTIAVAEGFAYYGLHPLAFVDALEHVPTLSSQVAVAGIRSIGTTLSAVTVAGLRSRGLRAERVTVRPKGHPYNRRTELSPDEMNFVNKHVAGGASFLVVDEGPGLSGSSFLSVGEALLRAGVPKSAITFLCSHAPSTDNLCTENAAERCRQFCWQPAKAEARKPEGARVWIGGGEWRRYLLPHESPWPASWLHFERLKYLSAQGAEPRFYKFLGFGHYGTEIIERETKLADAGYGVKPQIESDGFASYPFVDGHPMSASEILESVLARLAAYCAFRAAAFAKDSAELQSLQQMASHNSQQLKCNLDIKLHMERPVIADGRMQPHEWLLTRDGQMLKTDSGSHGDDHFFPGPVDIAWDLAGAIVEWEMSAAEAESFVQMYQRVSGDDAENRVADYIRAYAMFRWAYCLMAANAMQGTEENQWLQTTAEFYRTRLRTEEIKLALSSLTRRMPELEA